MPILLDEAEEVLEGYGPFQGAYAPYPRHVIVGKDGIIRYQAAQYDVDAMIDAIDEALAQ